MSDDAPEKFSGDDRLCRLCLMAAIVFAFGKEALMFIQRITSILIMGDTVPCTRCGSLVHSRSKIDASWNHDADDEEIVSLYHVICYGCSMEWVE